MEAKELVSTEAILEHLHSIVENNEILPPTRWVDASMRLAVLLGDESDKLFDLEQLVAQKRVNFIEAGDSVSKAKVKVEASDEYKLARKQKAKIEQIVELIRVAKLRARITETEYKSY